MVGWHDDGRRLRYRYRLYPDAVQREASARAFGCARVVFNDGLRARQAAREAGLPYVSDGELSKRVITEAKKTPQRSWLGEVSAVVLQQALADLNAAYRAFFASITARRKGPKVAAPRFRSKKDAAGRYFASFVVETGADVIVKDAGWNANLAGGASTTFGFGASSAGANGVPATVACTAG
ncbi:helix-turn-helix domain-containing protein [Streptosporangium sandarakinum]|uniref:helix-turn-helix domain-containing protein n=1 Tax=Streptosporangium sandarakinum TaxID=1260955 RepID=UPI003D91F9F1